ncbi:MAG: AAA family ATPase [Bradyrhizobium sp.]|nr:AAA family ATPase [Bradyrhizobium sp.]
MGDLGAELRMGELHMFASGPGVGKSVLALWIAWKLKLPTLYISADTSAHTQGVRLACMLTGETVAAVDKMMQVEPTFYNERIQAEAGHIFWDWNTSPDINDIRAQIESFAAVIGDYPHLVIVDNLRNIYSEEADTQAMQHACESLKTIAAETGSAVLVMHHVVGQYEDGVTPVPLSGLEQKVGKAPALVVTFSYGKLGDLRAAIVKSRYSAANAAGHLRTFIPFNTSIMRVG